VRVVVREDRAAIARPNALLREPCRPRRRHVVQLTVRESIDAIRTLYLDGRPIAETRNRFSKDGPEVWLGQPGDSTRACPAEASAKAGRHPAHFEIRHGLFDDREPVGRALRQNAG
jgi:hypothetical protein